MATAAILNLLLLPIMVTYRLLRHISS